jgi:hypothetical protein
MLRTLGVVSVAFGLDCPYEEAARRAAALGFDHLDVGLDRFDEVETGALALPVGDRIGSMPRTGCTVPAPRRCSWEEGVALLSREPTIRVEPGPSSLLDSADAVRAMCAEVPGLRITLDTGWSVVCGYDPLDVADLAGHVQLRQARPGAPQLHPDEPGDVDVAGFLSGLERSGYAGLLSVEYFDLPDRGLPLDDPVAHCVSMAALARPLLRS